MFTLFRALPILVQLGALAASVAALGGVYAVWHHKIYNAGYNAAISEIAHENAQAKEKVDGLKTQRRACTPDIGDWDQSNGVCIRK
jgi:hypothetical protein